MGIKVCLLWLLFSGRHLGPMVNTACSSRSVWTTGALFFFLIERSHLLLMKRDWQEYIAEREREGSAFFGFHRASFKTNIVGILRPETHSSQLRDVPILEDNLPDCFSRRNIYWQRLCLFSLMELFFRPSAGIKNYLLLTCSRGDRNSPEGNLAGGGQT